MDFLTPAVAFRPDGPFYGPVVSYLCQLHGFNEIASRGVRRQMDRLDVSGIDEMLAVTPDARTREAFRSIAQGGVTNLLAEPTLHAVVGDPLHVDIGGLADAIYAEHRRALSVHVRLSAGSLLLLAWEVSRDQRTTDPIWEFLRHSRNAAAHNGQFTFRHREPRRPASWRSKDITPHLEGRLLFTDGSVPGLLGPGDVVYLLADLDASHE